MAGGENLRISRAQSRLACSITVLARIRKTRGLSLYWVIEAEEIFLWRHKMTDKPRRKEEIRQGWVQERLWKMTLWLNYISFETGKHFVAKWNKFLSEQWIFSFFVFVTQFSHMLMYWTLTRIWHKNFFDLIRIYISCVFIYCLLNYSPISHTI